MDYYWYITQLKKFFFRMQDAFVVYFLYTTLILFVYQKALNYHLIPVFRLQITLVRSQHKSTNTKGYFIVLKPVFSCTKIFGSANFINTLFKAWMHPNPPRTQRKATTNHFILLSFNIFFKFVDFCVWYNIDCFRAWFF